MTRVAIAGFQHETNTFAPEPTPISAFETGGAWPELTRGAAVPGRMAGLNIPLSGFVAACPHELVPILWAGAEPGGPVTDAAFDAIATEIVQGIAAARPDAVYLDLHGAMVTPTHDDAEAELLARIRAVTGPELPIVVSLDLHGNLSPRFYDLASAVTIYRTYPHVDMAETGARAARLLERLLAGPVATAHAQVDLLIPITAQTTMFAPAQGLYAALDGLDCISADMALGFPPADIPDCGPSLWACADTPEAARAAVAQMAAALAAAEPAFDARLLPADAAVARALALPGPVVIADPQDNPGAGGTGDTTGLLAALLTARARDAVLAMLHDPAAAAAAHAAGPGAELDLRLGGQSGLSAPLAVRARVEALHSGTFRFTGPFYGGSLAQLGPMARLRLDGTGVQVIVGTRRAQNADQEMFRALGIEPAAHHILAVKSAVHFMADYSRITDRILFATAPGANPCHLPDLPYRRLRAGVRLGPGGPLSGG